MKAKKVNEVLKDIFKPKSKEEILKAIENISIASYELLSFFSLLHGDDKIGILKGICKTLKISPTEMLISRVSTDLFIQDLFEKALKNDKDLECLGRSEPNADDYCFSRKYKIIKFGKFSGFNYYVFPRKLDVKQLQKFIKELIFNRFNYSL